MEDLLPVVTPVIQEKTVLLKKVHSAGSDELVS
jgi:hypothetical protein